MSSKMKETQERLTRAPKVTSSDYKSKSEMKKEQEARRAAEKAAKEEEERRKAEEEAILAEVEAEMAEGEQLDIDPVQSAQIIFMALDKDSDGILTEDEFVEGCLADPMFLLMLETFSCDFLWADIV